MNKALFILGLFIVLVSFFVQYSNLHSVDLSWNVKHLNMVDDNGLVVQDVTSMYNRSIRMLWFNPFFMFTGFAIVLKSIKIK